MIRKLGLAFALLLVVGAIGFFGFAPGMAERSMNRIDGEPLPQISPQARALHASLAIVDLHSDTLLWQRNLLDRGDRGHMDLPRLQQGHVALQVFSSVTKTPKGQNYDRNSAESDNITGLAIGQLQPIGSWFSLFERAIYQGEKLDRAVAGSGGDLVKVTDPGSLDALLQNRADKTKWSAHPESVATRVPVPPVGAIFSAEGLHSLEGDIANLDRLHGAGMRMAGLTHFFDNELAGSMHGESKAGLTDFGRAVVRRMEELGMVVDIAHCSRTCVAEILAMARRPVVSSHGGVQATCKVNRNLTDDEIRGVAATGGVIGIGYWEGAVCSTDPRATARAMKHIRDLVGISHVALGSDYDGATTVRFDTASLVHVTQALMDEGFTPNEIRAVMGENALRVLRQGLVPLAQAKGPA